MDDLFDDRFGNYSSVLPEAARRGFRDAYEKRDSQLALKYYREMLDAKQVNEVSTVAMMKLLKLDKKFREAINIFRESEKCLEFPTSEMFTQLISILLQAGCISQCEQLIDVLEKDGNIRKSSRYYTSVLRFYSGIGQIEKANEVYNKVSQGDSHPLDTLLRCSQKFIFKEEAKGLLDSAIDEISKLGETVDDRVIAQFAEHIELSEDLFDNLFRCNIRISAPMIYKLMKTAEIQQRFDYSLKLYNTLIALGYTPTSRIFGDMLSVIAKDKDPEIKSNLVYIFKLMATEFRIHKIMPSRFFVKTLTYTLTTHPWSAGLKYEHIDNWKNVRGLSHRDIKEWVTCASEWVRVFENANEHRISKLDMNKSFLSV